MGARLLDWLPSGGPRLAVALLATVIAGGAVGYVAIEGWSPWDAFYMTVTTITTVGYREVHELDRPGQVFTHEQLLHEVWGYRDGSGARTVDSHVRALRRKLGTDVVRTVHGVGYAAGDVARGRAA